MENEKLWGMPSFTVSPGGDLTLKEVIQNAKVRVSPQIEDENPVLLAAILSGENADWRIYEVDQKNSEQLNICAVRRQKHQKLIKHGGLVTETVYQRVEFEVTLRVGDRLMIKKMFRDENLNMQSQSTQSVNAMRKLPKVVAAAMA